MKRNLAGEWFLGLGALHTMVGLLLGTGALTGLGARLGVDLGPHSEGALRGFADSGIVGSSMPKHAAQFGLLWFLYCGFFWMMLGALLRWLQRKHQIEVPPFVLWLTLGLAAFGIVVMPISGFWLLLVVSAGLLLDGGKPRGITVRET